MSNTGKLRDIAEYLGLSNVVSELEAIELRSKQENANLILPLVGEFSSGKTTLINALTDSKKLETATKPTTATIYEVHFGCDSCHAKVVTESGNIQDIDDIAELKNDVLADAKVVTVFDTSCQVPSTTILVDTPGLSSPDIKHKMKLSKRPIYLILTKSDTKSVADIESAKKYISENVQIPLKRLAVVSAATNNLDELYSLLDSVQKDKKEILKQVDGLRIENITNTLVEHVETLMNASNSDKDLEEAIRRSQYELDKISRNIDRLVDSMSDDIKEKERNISRKFEDTVFSKLNTLVTGKSNNFDGEAISTINNTATLLMNDYKTEIQLVLKEKARSQKGSENEVPLSSLESMDLSSIQMSGLSYNMDLNAMGHEYDGWIKTGVIAVAAVGTVAVVASTGGAAAGALATVDNVIDVADTVSDISSIVSNQKTVGKMEKAVEFVTSSADKYNSFNESNQQMGQQVGSDKGMIDSLVGFVTDKMLSKPQRVRAIRNYIDESLSPEFTSGLHSISQSLVNSIRVNLQNEASVLIGQKTDSLQQLRQEMKEKKEQFEQKMNKLREIKTNLLTM